MTPEPEGDNLPRPHPTLSAHQLNAISRSKGMAFPVSGDKRLIAEDLENRVRRWYIEYERNRP